MRYRNEREEGLARKLIRPGPATGSAPAIAVNERGARCTMHVPNLAQGDKTKPDYLKINPTARILLLIDPDSSGGKPLT